VTDDLPVVAVLPRLRSVLASGRNAVLVAPPGAGKTTAVAPALLDQPWCTGEVLILSPRRLAARAAAERMAALASEPVGGRIGYVTRLDRKVSPATRITVMTEGIFRNRIQAAPDLPGVSAVLFDEVHERSLDSDASLAFARDAQAGLRPDLRLVAMSATLDGARFAGLLDGEIVASEGRAWPLAIRYLGRDPGERIEDAMARAIHTALGGAEGGVLAFLPGVAEIERTAARLDGLGEGIEVFPLYGQLPPDAQRRAIAPSPLRKVVLATSIAESSLTLDGIGIVVDAGLARRPRYDRGAGLTRLATERVSQAGATQRAGRAARQGPGVAWRLWEEAATAGLPKFDPPEILEADLSALLLDCLLWGVRDPRELAWLDPPPPAAITEASRRLHAIGAIDGDGRVTEHGRAVARVPLPPRLAHMIVADGSAIAGEVAMLLTERGLGGPDIDIAARLRAWRHDRSPRATAARRAAARLANGAAATSVGECVALAFPDRVARRRGDGARWASVGGRGFVLDPANPLASSDWLAVAETQGVAAGARIVAAAAIDAADVRHLLGDRATVATTVSYDPVTSGVVARRTRRLGAIVLDDVPVEADRAQARAALVTAIQAHGLTLLPVPVALLARASHAGVTALNEAVLVADVEAWLPEVRRLSDLTPGALAEAWLARLDRGDRRTLDARAPRDFTSPAGSTHAIDYADDAPAVTLRVQALFGLATHPRVGDTPLVLHLTSPAGRPIQTTRDLPGFWAGSWASVAKEMRGRYPRHAWPDDPQAAMPSLRTKNALGKRG